MFRVADIRLLIDTHILLWADERPGRLAPTLRMTISEESNAILVSAASIWENAIKRAIGKLRFERPIVAAVLALGFDILPVSGLHAEHAGALPRHHDDPFDRLIIAQAYFERMVLGTQDRRMLPYGVTILGIG
ncbi:MAG TPA: type II toxin-antitoxin system VapC family toxin [Stellaceae bacterium]|nr:type II toxin-antitoxin system VapC family toxin [Stellaceae bacterium]